MRLSGPGSWGMATMSAGPFEWRRETLRASRSAANIGKTVANP